jgi:hypothetical protein
MYSFRVILAACVVLALVIFIRQRTTEGYEGQRKYVSHGNSNYPGNDLSNTWVKNTRECQKLCDKDKDKCLGFVVSKKRDTSRKDNKQLQCYLKSKDAFTIENRTRDTNWNSKIESNYYNYWSGKVGWGFAKDNSGAVTKDVDGKACYTTQKVKLYSDNKLSQGEKSYGCGDHEISADFPVGQEGGLSSFSVPPGLTLELYGVPQRDTPVIDPSDRSSYAQSGGGGPEFSPKLTGKGSLAWTDASGVAFVGSGVWNDRVKSIRVRAA